MTDNFFKTDTLLHLSAGFVITTIGTSLFASWLGGYALLIGIALAMLIGIGKEWRDKRKGGPFDVKDLWADFMGALLAAVALGWMMNCL